MKQILTKGILSAAMVAACLLAAQGQQVYSANCGDFFVSENDATYEAFIICAVGPFTVGESRYWTDANGSRLNGPHKTGDPVRSSTYFAVGTHIMTVPLSPKRTAIVGAIVLLVLGAILGRLMWKKYPRNRVEISK